MPADTHLRKLESSERGEAVEELATSWYLVRLTDLSNPIALKGGGGKKTGESMVLEWEV